VLQHGDHLDHPFIGPTVFGLAVVVVPVSRQLGDLPAQSQIVLSDLDPVLQAWPVVEQRLMRHFHHRRAVFARFADQQAGVHKTVD
jgi:hypothetical protein